MPPPGPGSAPQRPGRSCVRPDPGSGPGSASFSLLWGAQCRRRSERKPGGEKGAVQPFQGPGALAPPRRRGVLAAPGPGWGGGRSVGPQQTVPGGPPYLLGRPELGGRGRGARGPGRSCSGGTPISTAAADGRWAPARPPPPAAQWARSLGRTMGPPGPPAHLQPGPRGAGRGASPPELRVLGPRPAARSHAACGTLRRDPASGRPLFAAADRSGARPAAPHSGRPSPWAPLLPARRQHGLPDRGGPVCP